MFWDINDGESCWVFSFTSCSGRTDIAWENYTGRFPADVSATQIKIYIGNYNAGLGGYAYAIVFQDIDDGESCWVLSFTSCSGRKDIAWENYTERFPADVSATQIKIYIGNYNAGLGGYAYAIVYQDIDDGESCWVFSFTSCSGRTYIAWENYTERFPADVSATQIKIYIGNYNAGLGGCAYAIVFQDIDKGESCWVLSFTSCSGRKD